MKCSRLAFLSVTLALVSTGAAHAQTSAAPTQFDISLSGYEAFTSASSGHGTKQTPADSAGGMLEARYLVSSLVGFGMSFSFNPANQTFAPNGTSCEYQCANPATNLSAKASELALEWVPSLKIGRIRPFAIGGLGFFITVPSSSVIGTNSRVRPTYVFGGGLDFSLTSRFGIRLQYRDNVYKAPDLYTLYPATGAYTSSSEPMGGFFYRF